MTIFRRLAAAACITAGSALAFSFTPLAAQQPAGGTTTTASKGSEMVTLPSGWKVNVNSADKADAAGSPPAPGPQPAGNTLESTILLSAEMAMPGNKGNCTLTLCVCHFQVPTGEILPGELARAALMQGYTPVSHQILRTTTTRNVEAITVELTAANATGEQRVFTGSFTMPNNRGARYYLFTTRPAGNAVAAEEINTIIKSLDTPATPAPAAPPQLAQNNPAPAALQPGPGIGAVVPGPQQPPGAPLPPGAQPPGATPAPAPPGAQEANSVSTLPANAPVSAQAAQIVQDYHSALVMVEGNKGVGSGFLCKMAGHTYVVTNAHVLADNSSVKLTSLDGASYAAGTSAVAVDHDIVKMEVASAPKTFDVMDSLDSAAKIGDAVMIPGNAEGAQVVHPVEGKIVGIGPNLIEVDAPFVKGNSGSPIVHEATGKVLGVATYLMQRKVSQDDGTGKIVLETRRFGYRLDSVKQWQPINWQVFFAESQQAAAIEDLSEDFITMFNDMEHDSVSAEHYKSTNLVRAVRSFMEARHTLSMTASAQDRANVVRGFFADLRAISRGDIAAFNARPAYDYFRRDVDDQGHFRDALYDLLTRVMDSVNTAGQQPSRPAGPPGYQQRPPGY